MRIFIFLAMIVCSFISHAQDQSLKPFLTDYCTAYSEGTREKPDLWKHCCVEHDLYFWAGGSHDDRKETDLRLKSCVEATGEVAIARLIYLAVTIGGNSPIRFKTKEWGHSWEKRERYLSLTESETALILQAIETTSSQDLTPELRQSFKEQLNSRLDQ